ncbi:MAG: DUF3105 domain-containing protein [Thermoleophilia bacterium]|nr:DUF3105 domain-containing protein [Thermoleophilia bacterium]
MPPTPRPAGPKKKASVKVPSSGDDSNRRLLIGIGIAAAVVVIAGGLSFVLFGGGSGSTGIGGGASPADATKKLEAAGCTVKSVKSLASNDHSVLTPEGTSPKWNTSPPTSGAHYGQQAIWGSFTESLLHAQVVHNLEPRGIFIQYGKDVPQATIDQLQAFYGEHQNGTLLAPLPSLGSKIALGAWTTKDGKPDDGTAYLVKCTDFDEAAYAAFFAANQFKGPERFPMSSLLPGS